MLEQRNSGPSNTNRRERAKGWRGRCAGMANHPLPLMPCDSTHACPKTRVVPQCVQFRTDQVQDLKRFERLARSLARVLADLPLEADDDGEPSPLVACTCAWHFMTGCLTQGVLRGATLSQSRVGPQQARQQEQPPHTQPHRPPATRHPPRRPARPNKRRIVLCT